MGGGHLVLFKNKCKESKFVRFQLVIQVFKYSTILNEDNKYSDSFWFVRG